MPSLPLSLAAEKPGRSVSTRIKLCRSWGPALSGLVRQKTSTLSARVPLVMNILDPSMTHSPPSFTAVVRVWVGSDPAPGSVMPVARMAWPSTRGGRSFSFCSGGGEELNHLRTEGGGQDGLADSRVHGPELLGDKAVFQKAQAGSAVFLPDENPHKAQFASLFPQLLIKLLFPVELHGMLRKLPFGKLLGRPDDIPLFLAQIKVHNISVQTGD